MKSHPYFGIEAEVASVVKKIISSADDYHKVHAARLARSAEIIVKHAKSGTILELGTTGFFPSVIKKLRPDIEVISTHFDLKEEKKGQTTFSIGDELVTVDTYFVNLESDELPVEDETFDTVICCEVLEHMETDPMFMLSSVNRVLKTDGMLFLTTPNVLSSRGLHKIVRGVEPYFFMHYHRSGNLYRHNYEYTAKSLKMILSAAGFKSDVWTEDLFEDAVLDTVRALRVAGFKIENIGDNLLAVAYKKSGIVDRYPRGLYA